MKPYTSLFWSLSVEDAALELEADLVQGLTTPEAEKRQKTWGANRFGRVRRFSKARLFVHQFSSPLVLILLMAVCVTLFLHDWVDALIILFAITINAILGFYQENKAEHAIAYLRSYIQERTRVIRDGHESEIDAAEIVPGDVIHLVAGSRVPADARIVQVRALRVDESMLTGESAPVEKTTDVISEAAAVSERRSMVFGGTLVTEGEGLAIVTATGNATQIGAIAGMVEGVRSEQTPLQRTMAQLAWLITLVITVLVAGVFALGVYRGEPLIDMFLVSIAVAVGAIPEALPIGLTAVLAVGVEQLARRKGIMRSLAAAETLGSTTVIMTDKTGTLTQAQMQLVDIYTRDCLVDGSCLSVAEPVLRERFSAEQKDIVHLAACATDVLVENPTDDIAQWRMRGRPLEVNIVRTAAEHGVFSVGDDGPADSIQQLIPFSSVHKFSVTHVPHVDLLSDVIGKRAGHVVVVLGAPDVLLARAKMSKDAYVTLMTRVDELSREGKRLLGVAVQHGLHHADGEHVTPDAIHDLEFVGILAFYDPIRPGVPAAIRTIEHFGVRVVMATGDFKGTAIAVARNLGWNIDDSAVLSGEELRQLSDVDLLMSLPQIRVFARVTPEDKLRIARLYQKRGEIVAMTGDGINDAPSLKAVDIGIAVGSGTDVAKGVADLVLLDDNFEIIVAAIEEGKRIIRNIRKTFVYLMSNSLDEIILVGGSLLIAIPVPLTALQIIWVNFFTGSLPAIAFAFDRDHDTNTTTSPSKNNIITPRVLFLSFGIGAFTSMLLFALYWLLLTTRLPLAEVQTFLFACFGSYSLFVAFSLRSLTRPLISYNPFSNRFLVAGVTLGIALLAATIYVPPFQHVFNTVPLGSMWLLPLIGWVAFNILIVEIAKWIFSRK